jgi:DNA-binding beta-propeller fold protein YncE
VDVVGWRCPCGQPGERPQRSSRINLVPAAALAATSSPAAHTAGGTTASPPQQRQIAETTLTGFKVVLTLTRVGTSSNATLTAAGYQNVAGHWNLIGGKRIGAAGRWSWYSTDVCGLTVTQLKPEPSSAAPSDTLTVSLLMGPALGCTPNITETWGPATPPPATAYVVTSNPGLVTPVNTATNTPGKPLSVAPFADALAVTPNGQTLYVVSALGTVIPISTATSTPGKPISIGGYPIAIAITP